MNRFFLLACVGLCTTASLRVQATGYYTPQTHKTSAVDAKGVRHDGHSYKGAPPWLADRVSGPSPNYPVRERALGHEGCPIVRLSLDLKTGHVIKTSLLQSSGYPALDQSALSAFSRWTWRPGRWKEIDVPVRFEIANPSQPPTPRSPQSL